MIPPSDPAQWVTCPWVTCPWLPCSYRCLWFLLLVAKFLFGVDAGIILLICSCKVPLEHLTRTTVLSTRVLSVLVHSTACIQLDPFCSSDISFATRQWANPRGFAHKGFGRVLLSLPRSARRLLVLVRFCCCAGSGSAPTLPVLGSSHMQLS